MTLSREALLELVLKIFVFLTRVDRKEKETTVRKMTEKKDSEIRIN